MHLKSGGGDGTLAAVQQLGEKDVQLWMDAQLREAEAKLTASPSSLSLWCKVTIGDFNLSGPVLTVPAQSGSSSAPPSVEAPLQGAAFYKAKHTEPSAAWDNLLIHNRILLPPEQTTNFGPPVTLDPACQYDNALVSFSCQACRSGGGLEEGSGAAADPPVNRRAQGSQAEGGILDQDAVPQADVAPPQTTVTPKQCTCCSLEFCAADAVVCGEAAAKEVADFQALLDHVHGLRREQPGTDMVDRVVGEMKNNFQTTLFREWSDHKPICIRL